MSGPKWLERGQEADTDAPPESDEPEWLTRGRVGDEPIEGPSPEPEELPGVEVPDILRRVGQLAADTQPLTVPIGVLNRLSELFPDVAGGKTLTLPWNRNLVPERVDADPEAFAHGVTDAATLGFADEIAGAGRELAGGSFQRMSGGEGIVDARQWVPESPGTEYEQSRDAVRAEQDAARARAPFSYGAGEVVGTIPYMAAPAAGQLASSPIRAAGLNMLEGAGYGALEGFGSSDAEGAAALKDAIVPGLVGAGASGLMSAPQLVQQGSEIMAPHTDAMMEAANRLRVRSSGPRTLRDMRRVEQMGGMSQVADDIRRLEIKSPEEARQVADISGQRLQDFYGDVERALGDAPIVDVDPLRMRKAAEALEMTRSVSPAVRGRANLVREMSENLDEAYPFGQASFGQARADMSQYGQDAKFESLSAPASAEQYRDMRGGMRQALDEVVDRDIAPYADELGVDPDLAMSHQQDRRDFHVAHNLAEMGEDAQLRDATNRQVTPSDTAAAATGFVTSGGNPIAAVAGWRLNRALRKNEHATGARILETIVRMAQQDPPALGPYAQPILDAARRGQTALAVEDYNLSQSDPNYRIFKNWIAINERQEPELPWVGGDAGEPEEPNK